MGIKVTQNPPWHRKNMGLHVPKHTASKSINKNKDLLTEFIIPQ